MSGSTRSYEMARRLVALGHEVNMVTSWREVESCRKQFHTCESGISVHWIPVSYSNRMRFWGRIFAFFKFAFHSSLLAASFEADIVLASSTPLTIAIPALYASFRLGVPMVFEVRDLWPEMPIAMGMLDHPLAIRASRILEVLSYRHASAVIALSPGIKEGIVRAGCSPTRIAVIPNGCDNSMFDCQPSFPASLHSIKPCLASTPLLLYAGTFGRVNNVSYAVSLAHELITLGSDIRLLLIGSGSEFDSVRHKAFQSGVLNKNLFLEAPISKAEIPSLLAAVTMASNLVIDIPEARANSANKFFDTLAAGKPIFLNHGGWMHELVVQHDCGISGWGKSTREIAVEVDLRLHDLDWLARAGRSSRNLAEKYFDRDILVAQLEQVLFASALQKAVDVDSIAPGLY